MVIMTSNPHTGIKDFFTHLVSSHTPCWSLLALFPLTHCWSRGTRSPSASAAGPPSCDPGETRSGTESWLSWTHLQRWCSLAPNHAPAVSYTELYICIINVSIAMYFRAHTPAYACMHTHTHTHTTYLSPPFVISSTASLSLRHPVLPFAFVVLIFLHTHSWVNLVTYKHHVIISWHWDFSIPLNSSPTFEYKINFSPFTYHSTNNYQ